MFRFPCWLTATVLAVTLLAPTLPTPASPDALDISIAARLGAEIGALASAGARPAPPAGGAPRAASARARSSTATPALPDTPAPTVAPSPAPKKGKLIFLDPGHGGKDPGAVHTTPRGEVDLTEKEANLSIALKLARLLEQDGYDVLMSRSTDRFLIPGASSYVEIPARVDMANRAGADLYVSIHNNGIANRAMRGTEVWYCAHRSFAESNRRLASLVQEALVRNLRQAGYDTIDRGIKDEGRMGHFGVIGPHLPRPSRMPGIVGESLFVTNDQDAAMLKRDDIREAIARGYLEGIKAYFGDAG